MITFYTSYEFWPVLVALGVSLIPVFLWPIAPIFCRKCEVKEVGSFFWLDDKMYCDDCRPFLTDEEKECEKGFAEIIGMFIRLNGGERLLLPRHIRRDLDEIKKEKGGKF